MYFYIYMIIVAEEKMYPRSFHIDFAEMGEMISSQHCYKYML